MQFATNTEDNTNKMEEAKMTASILNIAQGYSPEFLSIRWYIQHAGEVQSHYSDLPDLKDSSVSN